ncbi:MAG TPA: DUF3299 domain-containing protein [Opitutaceae bacterium]
MKSSARPLLYPLAALVFSLQPWASAAIVPQGVIDHSFCCGPRTLGANAAYDSSGTGLSVMGAETLGAAVPVAATTSVTPVSTPAPAPAEPAAPAGEFEEAEGGYLKVGFDRLAGFRFVAPPAEPAATPDATPPTGEEQIPEAIKSLDGRKALVTGFMLPVKMDAGLVTEFLLVKDPMMCCYGAVPNMNEWIVVKMAKGVKPLMDVPISFYGQLHIGAMFEGGYMTGIYRLEGERMGPVQG